MVPVSGAAARRRMGSSTHFAGSTACEADDVRLYWKVVLINGAVLLAATLLLVLGPVSVSRRTATSEALVLAGGLVVMLLANALLLRSSFRPVEKVVAEYDAMLERLEAERTASTSRALQAQEAERQRVSRELHDEVGQSLTAVLLDLKHGIDLAPAEVVPVLERARETTRGCVEEVRRISQRLRPAALDDLGLVSALSGLASDFSARSDVAVTARFRPEVPELPAETELVVYRVAQEALTNIARHSGATSVRIDLGLRGDAVVLVVLDDGVGGVDPTAGSGIQGMRERALMVGGELSVTHSDDGGTEVDLRVPVPAAPRGHGAAHSRPIAGRRLARTAS